MKKQVIISFSAGVDSTVLAYYYKSLGYEVTLGTFDDGPSNSDILGKPYYRDDLPKDEAPFFEELLWYQNWHCNHAGFKRVVFRYPSLNLLTAKSAKLGNVESQLAEADGLNFYVGFKPLMGMILLSYATANNFDCVAFGHQKYNSHYKDESLESFKLLVDLMKYNYGDRVTIPNIEHPWYEDRFAEKEKVIQLGLDLGVPLDYTYSCRRGQRLNDGRWDHCRTCENCNERNRAFKVLNVIDPAP